MRLFLAIELPAEARVAVAALARRLAGVLGPGARTLRWVRSEHLHLTLVFLGEVGDESSRLLVEAMRVPFEQDAFMVSLAGLGTFPSRGEPRVLWLGVDVGASNLTRLHDAVARRLRGLDVTAGAAPFHPHLTLGRWRRSRPSDRAAVRAGDPHRTVASFVIESVALVGSRLTPDGPSHTILTRAALRASTTG